MNYYNHHLGDYAKDTGHLSLAEHGAYRMLLDHYYSTEKPLPENAAAVARICRANSKIERDSVESVLSQFFILTEGGYVHKRVERELENQRRLREKNAENGKRGGRPKETQKKPSGLFLGSISETQTKAYPITKNQEPNVLLEKEPKDAAEEKPESVRLDAALPGELHRAWEEWQAYRRRRNAAKGRDKLAWTYQAARMGASQVATYAASHGARIVCDRIASAIGGNWQGLNLDKLERQQNGNGYGRPETKVQHAPSTAGPMGW